MGKQALEVSNCIIALAYVVSSVTDSLKADAASELKQLLNENRYVVTVFAVVQLPDIVILPFCSYQVLLLFSFLVI